MCGERNKKPEATAAATVTAVVVAVHKQIVLSLIPSLTQQGTLLRYGSVTYHQQ